MYIIVLGSMIIIASTALLAVRTADLKKQSHNIIGTFLGS